MPAPEDSAVSRKAKLARGFGGRGSGLPGPRRLSPLQVSAVFAIRGGKRLRRPGRRGLLFPKGGTYPGGGVYRLLGGGETYRGRRDYFRFLRGGGGRRREGARGGSGLLRGRVDYPRGWPTRL